MTELEMRRVGTPCPRVYGNAHDTISFVIVIASGTKCSAATQKATTPPGYNRARSFLGCASRVALLAMTKRTDPPHLNNYLFR
jgi:hypothetical protein